MYVDESGDPGLSGSPTRYFVLTGLVIHESHWFDLLHHLSDFRRRMRSHFGLLMREEIHAGAMLTRPGSLRRISRNDRLTIIRHLLNELVQFGLLDVISVCIDKSNKNEGYQVLEFAWRTLLQRFENTLSYGNFRGAASDSDFGLVFCDQTDEIVLGSILRKMRRYNLVPNISGSGFRMMPLQRIVEDPNIRDSRHSYFIQAVDAVCWAIYQSYSPSSYTRVVFI